jgi:hypothetical protein
MLEGGRRAAPGEERPPGEEDGHRLRGGKWPLPREDSATVGEPLERLGHRLGSAGEPPGEAQPPTG